MREGLRGATAYSLFDGYCQRLVIDGAPLWRAHVAMGDAAPTMERLRLHLGGATSTQSSPSNTPTAARRARISSKARSTPSSFEPAAGKRTPSCAGASRQATDERDFPALAEFFAEGGTDYFAQLFVYGAEGDRSQGSGIVYSFTADRKGGFGDDDTRLLQATLPAVSLAMKAHAGHVIASGLLATYLGQDAGQRVHAGAVMRGWVDKLDAVLWYADIRGFTRISN